MNSAQKTTANDLPLGAGVRLLVSNQDGLVALDKPIGVMAHPNKRGDVNRSLLHANYDYDSEVYTWKIGDVIHRAWLINRLDSPTSGVILIALNAALSTTIKQLFSRHKVAKVYYALVQNTPTVPVGAWNDTLKKDVYPGKRTVSGGQQIPAKARYQVMHASSGVFAVSLLKLKPLTGRTHQLRVQCQNHGHPIVGDRTYGNFAFNREVAAATGEKRMMLHSGETTIRYTFKGKVRDFHAIAQLPKAFDALSCFRPGRKAASSETSPATFGQAPRRLLQGRRFKQ
jgi:tRNA pseudouridine65 synthase